MVLYDRSALAQLLFNHAVWAWSFFETDAYKKDIQLSWPLAFFGYFWYKKLLFRLKVGGGGLSSKENTIFRRLEKS